MTFLVTPDVLVGLRKQNIRGEFFCLSALNLKDIPHNGDSRETLVRVHVKYVLSKSAFMSKTVTTFVQKVGLIRLRGGFLLQLFRTQMQLLATWKNVTTGLCAQGKKSNLI